MTGIRELQSILIESLADDGLGRARVTVPSAGEREIAVRNALPGETVDAVVRRRRKGLWFAQGSLQGTPSPERVSPRCAHFERCGGCIAQHRDYACQLDTKLQHVAALVAACGLKPPEFEKPLFGPAFEYRHKARLGVRYVDGELLIGFREVFSNRVVRMQTCEILAPQIRAALPGLAQVLSQCKSAGRIPQIEVAAGDHDCAFVVRHLEELTADEEKALAAWAEQTGCSIYLQPAGYESLRAPVTGAAPQPLSYGLPDLDLRFEFMPTDFTQVNPHVNRLLVNDVIQSLDLPAGSLVTDLFCGIGNFSLALARRGCQVYGYEGAAGAVGRARRNATLNGLDATASFDVADLHATGDKSAVLPDTQALILDPPRSGAGPNLASWCRAPALERIAYVSCNPETFAKDAVVLAGAGFRWVRARIFDMFPHTAHVETFGLFVRG
ncbi:MAG: 23S rRNA (uracil(1939)-C(5))-methyltransferase RlmD [Pseudomonadales bacterium]